MEMPTKVAWLMAFVCMVVIAPHAAEAALSCSQITSTALPCVSFLTTGGRMPVPACCNAVRRLNSEARTTPDRQATCRCLISLVKGIRGINPSNVSRLPGSCGVKLPYHISPTMDCSKVT